MEAYCHALCVSATLTRASCQTKLLKIFLVCVDQIQKYLTIHRGILIHHKNVYVIDAIQSLMT